MTVPVDPALAAELRATLTSVLDAARAPTLQHFRSAALVAENKAEGGAFDPVTAADRAAEAAMRDILARDRPADGILGEEFPAVPGTSGLTWVLDPIDGTRAYISGAPTWGVLVGLDAGAGPILGAIDQPWIGERFIGGFGRATQQRDGSETPLATRPCATLAEAVLLTTFPEIGTSAEREGFEAVRDRVRLTRYGLDCYAYALVAAGQVDLVIEAGLAPYDIQGPMAVIEAAGGLVTDWQGGPAHRGGRILAAGDRRVHEAARTILQAIP
ncbi:MAG: inositol monophosphatase family protein [Pseudomonadota bacterium]